MKIIIVGAGVAGLSLYLQLRKVLCIFDSHEILIYESHNLGKIGSSTAWSSATNTDDVTDSTAVVGNNIALAPKAMRLLKLVDTKLYSLFKSRGYVSKSYTFRTARGHTLAIASTSDMYPPREYSVSCPRYVLWQCLHDIVGEANIQHQKVVEVDLRGSKPLVRLANGRQEIADLVVGADGVRSVVKAAIFGEEDKKAYKPTYEGFCGVGGLIDLDLPEVITMNNSMVFTFGPTGSFGYCSAAPESERKLGWWSNWGKTDIPDRNTVDPEEIRQQLRNRHGTWNDPVIRTIIEKMETDCMYPIWTTPDLPCWAKRNAVLLGDAAHTLQATSGQGVCQALEDSVTFSLLLAYYVGKVEIANTGLTVEGAVELAGQGLYEIRSPKVTIIKSRARNLYLTNKRITNVVIEYFYYCFIYVWVNFPLLGKHIVGNVFREPDEYSPEDQVRQYLIRKGHSH